MPDLTYCLDQWEGLRTILSELDKMYSAVAGLPRQRTILHLIRALEQYGQGQLCFFFEGFRGRSTKVPSPIYPKLKPSDDFPDEHVLATTLAQISADITLIQRAAEQRRFPLQINATTTTVDVLARADNLAATALWPDGIPYFPICEDRDGYSFNGDFEVKTILTYFQKSVDVRVLPYAQVALIGIPYTCIYDLRSFMAIPHEVGHFRLWYPFRQLGTSTYTNLREQFYLYRPAGSKQASLADQWAEEIFADVYSALLGGPLAALTAQEMALQHSTANFSDFGSSDEHPSPQIRPAIHLKAISNFNAVGKPLSSLKQSERDKVAKYLLQRWEKILTGKGLSLSDAEAAALMSPDLGLDPKAPVDELISMALKALGQVIAYPLDWGWSDPSVLGTWTISKLDTQINSFLGAGGPFDGWARARPIVDDSRIANLPSFNNPSVIPPLWEDWVKNGKRYLGSNSLQTTLTLDAGVYPTDVDPKPTSKKPTPSIDKWVRVFASGGWATGGPCHDPPI